MKWAFVDESFRPGRMVIAAVVAHTGDVAPIRQAMRRALLPGQRRLHLTDERPARRGLILDLVARQPLEAVAIERSTKARRTADVRRELLTELVSVLVSHPVRRIVLERIAEELLENDRSTMAAALASAGAERVIYDHDSPNGEPMLWAADAVAWAAGAGGHQRARLARILQQP